MRRSILVPLLAGLLVLAGCSSDGDGGDDTAQLRDFVDAQAEAQDALRAQLAELEDRIAASGQDEEIAQQLRDATEQLEGILGRLDGLEEDLAAETEAREGAVAAADAGRSQLSGQIEDLASQVAELRSQVSQLAQAYTEHCRDGHCG